MANYYIGVDVGGTTVKMGLFPMPVSFWKNGRSRPERRMAESRSFRISLRASRKRDRLSAVTSRESVWEYRDL